MPVEPQPRRFIVAGVTLTLSAPLVSVIGRADGDIEVGDVLIDELDGRELGVVAKLIAYRRELVTVSSGMTCEVHLAAVDGSRPFRVPSMPLVRSRPP